MNACQSVSDISAARGGDEEGRKVGGLGTEREKKKTEFQIIRTKSMDKIGWEERTDRVGDF